MTTERMIRTIEEALAVLAPRSDVTPGVTSPRAREKGVPVEPARRVSEPTCPPA